MNKITMGEVKMRTRVSIWFEKLGINGGMAVLASLLVLVSGLLLYWINSNNDLLLGGYGRYGLFTFAQSFPYALALVFLLLFMILILLFRTFDFSYKNHFLAIVLVVFMGALFLGWLSMRYPLGQRLYQQEGRLFRMGIMDSENAVSGVVTSTGKDTISILNADNKEIVIAITRDTHFPFGNPAKGDVVRSVGEWRGNAFLAIGVRVFDETNPSTLGPMMRGRGQGRGMMRSE